MKNHPRLHVSELLLIILVLISGSMLTFSTGTFVVNFKVVGFTVMSSMQKSVSYVVNGVVNTFDSVKNIATLKRQNEELQQKLENYEFLQRNNTEVRKENERLRKELDFSNDYEYDTIIAQIIGRNPDSLYSGITINKGSNSGIRKGMPVIAVQDGNVGVVGKIVTVGLGASIIMPVFDSQCNISARIQNTRDIGIVSGNGSDDIPLSMKYIRKRAQGDFNFGDIVVTSGENDNYMRDVPIGTISSIKVLDYDSSLDIDLEPMLDFARLEIVQVVNKKSEPKEGN